MWQTISLFIFEIVGELSFIVWAPFDGGEKNYVGEGFQNGSVMPTQNLFQEWVQKYDVGGWYT